MAELWCTAALGWGTHSPKANIGAHNPDLLGYAKQVTARKHLNVTALMQIYWVRAALSEGPLQRVGREPADGPPLRQQITIFVWQLHAHIMDQMVEGASATLDQVCCPTGAYASPAHSSHLAREVASQGHCFQYGLHGHCAQPGFLCHPIL